METHKGLQDDDCLFASFMERSTNRERLLRVATRILPPDEAEDAVHDAIVQALAHAADFRGEAQLGTWMHRIVVNAALMRLRRKRRAQRNIGQGRAAAEAPRWLGSAGGGHAPGETLEHHEDLSHLREAVNNLPDGYREVVERCGLGGQSPDAAAQELGLTAGGVRTRLGRARKQLAELLVSGPTEVQPGRPKRAAGRRRPAPVDQPEILRAA